MHHSNRYEIVRRLGAGGMGVVYEAFDHERGERVALKTLHELDPAALYRLKNEAKRLRAGIAARRGDLEHAVSLYRAAAVACEAAELTLHAVVARLRLGELIGGDEGRKLVEAGEGWLERHRIASPGKFSGMIAPVTR